MKYPRHIYAITHNKTGRTYVGSSSHFQERISHHFCLLRRGEHSIEDMQADYDEHGNDFTVRVLDRIECHDDREQEYEWMSIFRSTERGFGYNYKDNTVSKRHATRKINPMRAKDALVEFISSLKDNEIEKLCDRLKEITALLENTAEE